MVSRQFGIRSYLRIRIRYISITHNLEIFSKTRHALVITIIKKWLMLVSVLLLVVTMVWYMFKKLILITFFYLKWFDLHFISIKTGFQFNHSWNLFLFFWLSETEISGLFSLIFCSWSSSKASALILLYIEIQLLKHRKDESTT